MIKDNCLVLTYSGFLLYKEDSYMKNDRINEPEFINLLRNGDSESLRLLKSFITKIAYKEFGSRGSYFCNELIELIYTRIVSEVIRDPRWQLKRARFTTYLVVSIIREGKTAVKIQERGERVSTALSAMEEVERQVNDDNFAEFYDCLEEIKRGEGRLAEILRDYLDGRIDSENAPVNIRVALCRIRKLIRECLENKGIKIG